MGNGLVGSSGMAAAVILSAVSAIAQQADAPTKKDPIRFSAFAVSMTAGEAGQVQIAIERWTTDEERKAVLDVLPETTSGRDGQEKLLKVLQDIEPRAGFIKTPKSLGWDIKFARENVLEDGTRRIVIATDKPVGFLAASRGSRILDYPFTLVEMRMTPDGKGEGRLLAATAIGVEDGKLQLENYGQQPVRLTTITQESRKKDKK